MSGFWLFVYREDEQNATLGTATGSTCSACNPTVCQVFVFVYLYGEK